MTTREDLKGPARCLADHPAVWALSLAGAAGAAAALSRERPQRGAHP